VKTQSLKDRFESFMSSGDFAESIDLLARSGYSSGLQRADYLAWGCSVIIEQKSLDQDVDAKVQALVGDLVRTYGSLGGEHLTLAEVIGVIGRLPGGNPYKPRLLSILTQRIDDLLAKADKQTRDTN
jgi:hypothetical protein